MDEKIGVFICTGYGIGEALDIEALSKVATEEMKAGFCKTVESCEGSGLEEINKEIQGLRDQQKVILRILENKDHGPNSRVLTKETWGSILRASGLDEAGMRNWHIEFEKTSPEAHQDFLESIGIEKEEITLIRQWSRPDNPGE